MVKTVVAIVAILLVILTLSVILWFSDSTQVQENTNSGIVVMTSFYPLYEFTKQVGGDHVNVSLLVPKGVEPHDWEPTIKDIQKIESANAVIINGGGFENWVDDILVINSEVKIIDTSNGIEYIQSRDDTSSIDPHFWLNPVMAQIQVQNIADALSEIDSSNESVYQENSKQFKDKLSALDQSISQELSNCKKDFLAFHNAFSYFANQYGLTQHTVVDTSGPHSEPNPKTLENIIKLSDELDITIIFSEEGVDDRISQVLAKEIGVSVLTLSPIEIADDESYIKKMQENLENLKVALCQS